MLKNYCTCFCCRNHTNSCSLSLDVAKMDIEAGKVCLTHRWFFWLFWCLVHSIFGIKTLLHVFKVTWVKVTNKIVGTLVICKFTVGVDLRVCVVLYSRADPDKFKIHLETKVNSLYSSMMHTQHTNGLFKHLCFGHRFHLSNSVISFVFKYLRYQVLTFRKHQKHTDATLVPQKLHP